MRKLQLLFWASLLLISCSGPSIPSEFKQSAKMPTIYPDYIDVTVPVNIAPLTFEFDGEADEMVARYAVGDNDIVCDGRPSIDDWRALTQEAKGGDITVEVYTRKGTDWTRFKPFSIHVSPDSIDPYISYRLISPSFVSYESLTINQRCLENYDESVIYDNILCGYEKDGQCINCHHFQQYNPQRMQFHARQNLGGTIIAYDGKIKKVNMKNDSILSAGVYPAWHPKLNLIVYSSDKTHQSFHTVESNKVEVYDLESDIIAYDVDKNEVRNIIATPDFETFPCWNPAGDKLYFCSAHVRQMENVPDSMAAEVISHYYDSVYYDLKCMSFDMKSLSFGKPETVVNASASHKSITVPRISPDGRYILFTLGDYGQFHIWHKSSDLWVMDLKNDSAYALKEANSPDVDSYHTWSSNGRWIVFASRRMDGNYSRAHIAYFDKGGKAHKAFCMPQRDPEHNILLLKSYNVPELTKNAVRVNPEALRRCIYETAGDTARFTGNIKRCIDGNTGASLQVDGKTGASPKKK